MLHGGSGTPEYQIRKAIEYGEAKINVNTECMQAWAQVVRAVLTDDSRVYDQQAIVTLARGAIASTVKGKIREFGTNPKV